MAEKKEKFNWNTLTSTQKDSVLTKVVKPFLNKNWQKFGPLKKGLIRRGLKAAGKEMEKAQGTR